MIKFFQIIITACTFFLITASSDCKAENIFDYNIHQHVLRKLSLDRSDIKNYKKIFSQLKKQNFTKIDELSAKIENPLLLGTVKAAKYLDKKYSSQPAELQSWLSQNPDHPFFNRIQRLYKLKTNSAENIDNDDTWLLSSAKISAKYLKRLNKKDKIFLTKNTKEFRNFIREGKTLAARRILENSKFQKLAPKTFWDGLAATLALKYFVDNYDQQALDWGEKASKRHNSGMATWIAGLASWRLKKFKIAASYFAKLGSSQNSDKWLVAAGAYWSARAYLKIGNTLKAQEMYKLAARHKYTFYGILAAYQIGQKLDFSFNQNLYITDFNSPTYLDEILQSPALRRAAVLMELKQNDLASQEIIYAYSNFTPVQKEAAILMAHQKGMHSLVIALSRQPDFDEILSYRYEKEIYPLPEWSQQDNWQIDKALLLALIRQESAFKHDASSRTGAKGLMQLMPATASYISGDKTLKRNKDKLYNPDFNLRLGQKYVTYLLTKPFIEGNLFFMLTAYNAGPGNLVKWQKNSRYQNDPLLYIEVIPSAETRIYLERVLANYWIYNIRLNNSNPTLEQVASEKWPVLEQYKQIIFE